MKFFNYNYGDFSPNFMGVRVNLDINQHYFFNEFGSTEKGKERFLGEKILDEQIDNAFDFYSVVSSLDHEIKHFYDFFLSPFGNRLFRLQIYLAYHSVQFYPRFEKQKVVVPVPLGTWINLNDNERKNYMSYIKPLFPNDYTIYDFENCDVKELFEIAIDCQNRISQLLKYSCIKETNFRLEIKHLFEANAVLIQIQAIYNTFGEEQMIFFAKSILNSKSDYSIVIKALYSLWDNTPFIKLLHILHTIITWCLLGDYSNDDNPILRLSRVFNYLQKNKLPSVDMIPSELFFFLENNLAQNDIFETFGKIEEANDKFAIKVISSELCMSDPTLIKSFKDISCYIKKSFLENMDNYLLPYFYNSNKGGSWFKPPIKVNLLDGYHKIEDLKEMVIPIQYIDDESQKVTQYLIKGEGVSELNRYENYHTLSNWIDMSNYLFSPYNRDNPDYDAIRKVSIKRDISFFEYIN